MNDFSATSATVVQLMALIRSSLWQTPIERLTFSVSPINWDHLALLSMQQTVAPLALNAALRLPPELGPDKEWILKAYSFVERNRRTHLLLDKTVADVTAKLSGEGIIPILLKGQAYAQVYPDPTLRQCGDIDLYVGEENYRRAYDATKRFLWDSEEAFNPDAKHYGCYTNGVRVELHKIAGELPLTSANRIFQEWSRHQLQSGRNLNIRGKEIGVPSPLFDVIFVFMHLYLHFINGGIGLRQVCDWTMLLHYYHNDIDNAELEKLLKKFHLIHGWQSFTPIAVKYLGLPEKECPFYSLKYSKAAERILSFILKEGNFGRATTIKNKRPKGYLAGKLYSFGKQSKKQMSKLPIDPLIILRYYCSYIFRGSKHVIKDLLTGHAND